MAKGTVRTLALAALLAGVAVPAHAGQYLVTGSNGPGFTSPEEQVGVLEKGILPTFDKLMKLQADKKILAGGLPVGDRAIVFIVDAASNDEVDRMLRALPAWGALDWKVVPLQTFKARAAIDQDTVDAVKKVMK